MDEISMKRALAGDREAFARLVGECESKLFRTALAITGNRADAEDAWQNTVLSAYRSVRTLREPHYFATWLTRILLNECKQIIRKRAKQAQALGPADAHLPEMGTERVDLQAALAELPPEQREAVILRFWLGMSLAEIAKVTDVPEGTAKTRLYQALKRMRVKLEEVQ